MLNSSICVSGDSFTGMRNHTNLAEKKDLEVNLFYQRTS